MVQDSTVVFPDFVGGYYCVYSADARGAAQAGGDGGALIFGKEKRALTSLFIFYVYNVRIQARGFCVG